MRRQNAKPKQPSAYGGPGLRLPIMGGVFVLDTFSGQPSLDELAQNESQRNLDAGRNDVCPSTARPPSGNNSN